MQQQQLAALRRGLDIVRRTSGKAPKRKKQNDKVDGGGMMTRGAQKASVNNWGSDESARAINKRQLCLDAYCACVRVRDCARSIFVSPFF